MLAVTEGIEASSFAPQPLFARLREAALEVLAPTRCAACERPGALICDDCRARMVPIDPVHACTRCGAPFGELLCTECRDADIALDRCLAAVVFDGPPSRIIRAYKDGGERRLAPLLADLMLDAARRAEHTAPERYGGMLTDASAVTFVPATAGAYRRRGFDHMEVVARHLAAGAGLPFLDALAKHGRADQRRAGRVGRARQARDAYEVVLPVQGQRLLLLDDVITTGATVNAAAAALKAAGAERVDVLAFARVWR